MSRSSIVNRRNRITTSIINNIISKLETYDGDVYTIKVFADRFNTLDKKDKVEFIEDIVEFQTLYVIECMKKKENVSIPVLGSFIIKDNKLLIMKLSDEVAREKGYADYNSCPIEVRRVIWRGLSENIPDNDDEEGIRLRNRRINMFRENKRKKKYHDKN